MPAHPLPIQHNGLATFHVLCEDRGLSTEAAKALLSSISPDTLKTYSRLWSAYVGWTAEQRYKSEISIPMICDFLIFLFKKGYSANYLNSARSSLSFFTLDSLEVGNDFYVKKLFRYFYLNRPIKPKYLTYWPVAKVLNLLKSWHPMEELDLKRLTLKTLALIALTSSDRGQTLHLLNLKDMTFEDDHIIFVIFSRIKTTRRVLKPTIVKCISSESEELNVSSYVRGYIERTKEWRSPNIPKSNQLFLSFQTHKPVSKQSLARWLTHVLSLANIDTSKFSSHSYRGAGLSAAYKRGASAEAILKSGNWTNVGTFKSFYNAPSTDSNVGRLILDHLGERTCDFNLDIRCFGRLRRRSRIVRFR